MSLAGSWSSLVFASSTLATALVTRTFASCISASASAVVDFSDSGCAAVWLLTAAVSAGVWPLISLPIGVITTSLLNCWLANLEGFRNVYNSYNSTQWIHETTRYATPEDGIGQQTLYELEKQTHVKKRVTEISVVPNICWFFVFFDGSGSVSSFILLYLILFNKVTGKGYHNVSKCYFYKTLQYMKQIKIAKQ